MTVDMESVFRRKVEEKEEKMVRTSKEEEEKVELSRKELEEVKEVLERRRAELEEEKRSWESENNTSLAGILLAGKIISSLCKIGMGEGLVNNYYEKRVLVKCIVAGSTDSLGSRKKKHSMTVNPFKFGRT